jgi:CHAT domain-containing protein
MISSAQQHSSATITIDSLLEEGQYDKALRLSKKTDTLLKAGLHTHNDSVTYFSFLINQYALCYEALGQFKKAEEIYQLLLPVLAAKFPERPDLRAESLRVLAQMAAFAGYMQQGAVYQRDAEILITGAAKKYPRTYALLLTDMIALAALRQDFTAAMRYLFTLTTFYEDNHIHEKYVLDTYIAAVITYLQIGDKQQAGFFLSKAEALCAGRQYAGLSFSQKGQYKNLKAVFLMGTGYFDAAERVLRSFLHEVEKAGRTNDKWYGITYISLAYKYILGSDKEKMMRMLEKLKKNATILDGYAGRIINALYNYGIGNYKGMIEEIDFPATEKSYLALFGNQRLMNIQLLKMDAFLRTGQNNNALELYVMVMQEYKKQLKEKIHTFTENEKYAYSAFLTVSVERGASLIMKFQGTPLQDSVSILCYNAYLLSNMMAFAQHTRILTLLRGSEDTLVKRNYETWVQLKRALASGSPLNYLVSKNNIDSLKMLTERLERDLINSRFFEKYDAVNGYTNFSEIRKNIKPGEILIDFAAYGRVLKIGDKGLYMGAYLITSDCAAPLFVPLCSYKDLRQLGISHSSGNQLAVLYTEPGLRKKGVLYKGDQLYNLILKPLEKYFTGKQKIFISPGGVLHQVAFHALMAGPRSLLGELYEIKYLFNAASLTHNLSPAASAVSSISIWGGVEYGNKPLTGRAVTAFFKKSKPQPVVLYRSNLEFGFWPSLPGSSREVKTIEKIFKEAGRQAILFTGDNAGEANFKQKGNVQYDILHISTHGYIDTAAIIGLPEMKTLIFGSLFSFNHNPLLQHGLVWAGANTTDRGEALLKGREDGITTAYEISVMDLSHVKLVVLSSCESGLGYVNLSEGAMGLQRALKIAGVQKMIVSLWKVPDKQTQELMTLFYTNLVKTGDIETSFRSAQKAMSKKYTPFFWAGFVLVE